MSEVGLYSPSRGYWQTTNRPNAKQAEQYPEDTVEVPLKPGDFHDWDGTKWVDNTPPPPTDAELDDKADKDFDEKLGTKAAAEQQAYAEVFAQIILDAGIENTIAKARTRVATSFKAAYAAVLKADRDKDKVKAK